MSRKLQFQDTGQVLVEAALTIMLFLMLLFAVFEAGRLIQVQQFLTDAAREGARTAIAPLTGTSTLAPRADVVAVVTQFLQAGGINIDPATIAVDYHFRPNADRTLYTRVTVPMTYTPMTLALFNLNIPLQGIYLMREETSP